MIYVFKTSVKTKTQVKQLKPEINSMLPNDKWNFDLHDCDRILRVEGSKIEPEQIIYLMSDKGYACHLLD